MKENLFSFTRLSFVCLLISYGSLSYSQKDTLHIYYKGLATLVLDSNYNKIGKWADAIKGKRYEVEILAYYDVSDFKKIMAERAENVQTVVIRKSRDFTTIKFSGPTKGKKSQRAVLDIVYAPEGYVETAKSTAKETKKETPKAAAPESSGPAEVVSTARTQPAQNKAPEKKKEKPKQARDPRYDYIVDSTYVNGELQITERKVKKVAAEKPGKSEESAASTDKPAPAPENKKKEKTKSSDDKFDFVVDSTYVNGVLEVTKRKVKKTDRPKAPEENTGEAPATEKPTPAATENNKKEKTKSSSDDKYIYITDSVYVNGVLEVTKRKVKKQQAGQ
jgi:hypothetical protein